MVDRVSILIPCCNAESYISETLNSVVCQMYSDWECIVVDDQSIDKSVEIISDYCERFSEKMKLYINPRKGACAARNFAFEKSTGKYIQYLDADDILSSDKISSQIPLLENNTNTISTCSWSRFKENISNSKQNNLSVYKNYHKASDLLFDMWNYQAFLQTSVWLTPRHIIEEAGPWNETLQKNQDGEFFCRVLLCAESVLFSDRAKVFYRDTVNSLGGKQTYESLNSQLYSYELYEYNLQNHMLDSRMKAALLQNYLRFYVYSYPFSSLLSQKAKQDIDRLSSGSRCQPYYRKLSSRFIIAILGYEKVAQVRLCLFSFAAKIKTVFS